MKYLIIVIAFLTTKLFSQESVDSSLLTIDRIYNSTEFKQEHSKRIQWIENGDAYVTLEKSKTINGGFDLVRWTTKSQKRTEFIAAEALVVNGKPLSIEKFTLSPDGSKVLIFNNSSRVWRSKTKGDFWVYDLTHKKLKQLGEKFEPSSLMFAKFSVNNQFVAYVHDFNIYKEAFQKGTITQLTTDGNGAIINGTFDWAYEEEFGKRDGFSWSPDAQHIAFWQIDASDIGTYYMINYTDSVYSKPIPLQYPKVGEEPSGAKIGVVNSETNVTTWIPLEGDEKENYIPGLQWVNKDLLLVQQMNRHQNKLIVWTFQPSTGAMKKIYTEKEDTWIELLYPDISGSGWRNNDLPLVDHGESFLRMTETDGWRHVYKVNIATGKKLLITPGEYDVAAMNIATEKALYFMASPTNSTQRYLYQSNLNGEGTLKKITPDSYPGINAYNISPNGAFAIHTFQNINKPRTTRLISLPNHKTIKILVENKSYIEKLSNLDLPKVKFTKVTTDEGIEIDVKMILPINFDSTQKYPVLFFVYGEPWGQVATDTQIGLWNIMLAQKGYVIISMDNRGTPCLKGSEWRKSIYRKVGVINTQDQASAAKEILKLDYLDNNRTAVWGWSGGGTMTLNLLFKFPEIYKTGIAVAAVSDQLIYDNIYQERYMGLPQENKEDFINGSPVTYAKNLEGNLLIIHGTGDDNVHYQSVEILVDELIAQNKQFQMMAYPNRSHGIYEGKNTSRHLYTLMTNYLLLTTPPN